MITKLKNRKYKALKDTIEKIKKMNKDEKIRHLRIYWPFYLTESIREFCYKTHDPEFPYEAGELNAAIVEIAERKLQESYELLNNKIVHQPVTY